MRRYLGFAAVTLAAAFCLWRTSTCGSRAHAQAPAGSRPGMTQAEWRYFDSQAAHWRQCVMKR